MNNKNIKYYVEGFADKVLLALLEVNEKSIQIQGSNSKIATAMENQESKYHKILIGLTDLDKKNVPKYFQEFKNLDNPDNILFKQKAGFNQYLIFLKPALEKWLIDSAHSSNTKLEDYSLPTKLKELRRITKRESILKNQNFKDFIRAMKRKQAEPIFALQSILYQF
jgi:hypothetical protein